MTVIDLGDQRRWADLGTFVARARRVSVDGAVRLQTFGPILVLTVAVLEPSGLLGEGSVLGMRVMPVAEGAPIDVTVPIPAVSDRLAREAAGTRLSVPPMTIGPSWSGVAPPRSGWERVGEIDCTELDRAARHGIELVARGVPEGAGSLVVAEVRRRVWGEPTGTVPPVPAGMAFAAHTLGFTRSEERASVTMHGGWTRLTTTRGHVLAR